MTRDLMHGEEIREIVRNAYRHVPPTTAVVADRLYDEDQLALVPRVARDRALGVANHLRHADLRAGDVVLDLGCGGGIDTVLAGHAVGPQGRVVALDFVVISNGVVNLSARKARAMAEAARVLRRGGRFCVSDLTVEQEGLPPEILTQPAAWAGCVAGALSEEDFVAKLARAGFREIHVLERRPLSIDDCALYPLFPPEVIDLMRRMLPPERHPSVAVAAVVSAVAPGG